MSHKVIVSMTSPQTEVLKQVAVAEYTQAIDLLQTHVRRLGRWQQHFSRALKTSVLRLVNECQMQSFASQSLVILPSSLKITVTGECPEEYVTALQQSFCSMLETAWTETALENEK